jgi:S-DNA-T family DNA segregation ATPase FtsK/SpoIIIE
MYEVQPSAGVKVSKIVNLSDDIALNLAASQVRIVAPIPGKAAVGIEVPNEETSLVTLREVIDASDFTKSKNHLKILLGKDIQGRPIVGDLDKMPHLLIAGATGSGKSVCVNTIITSILFNATPEEVKFLMIDPKVVELSNYNGIPHLILPVVTDPKKASVALGWAVTEMDKRYELFAAESVRDVDAYNKKVEQGTTHEPEKLPKIVVIIDELADLMMVAPGQVEDAICRLAQKARASGIHLIVATQRPSVDVITGLIKANIPSRIAFSVSSSTDSRTILDMGGAEKLLGRGDMLYYPTGMPKPMRVQGAFLSDEEVADVVGYVKKQVDEVDYQTEILERSYSVGPEDEEDEYLPEAIELVIEQEQASTSMLQRRFRVGYNRAARMIDAMEERGIIGPSNGSKPREVLMSQAELDSLEED